MATAATTYIAFLRAINVPGHAIVRMTDLKDVFAASGCKNVRTYIQSGNVIFECPEQKAAVTFDGALTRLQQRTGRQPEIMFRTLGELETIVKSAPFQRLENDPVIKFYVAFLGGKPRTKLKLPLISDQEALEVIGYEKREVFIVSRRKPSGFFGFPNNFIEKELGVSATSRNWSTVTKVAAFARETCRAAR